MDYVETVRSIVLALIASVPGILALFMRNKTIKARAEAVAAETTTSQFDLLYQEARRQVQDCRQECQMLKTDLKEAIGKESLLERKVDELEDKIVRLEQENVYLKMLVNRLGGHP